MFKINDLIWFDYDLIMIWIMNWLMILNNDLNNELINELITELINDVNTEALHLRHVASP